MAKKGTGSKSSSREEGLGGGKDGGGGKGSPPRSSEGRRAPWECAKEPPKTEMGELPFKTRGRATRSSWSPWYSAKGRVLGEHGRPAASPPVRQFRQRWDRVKTANRVKPDGDRETRENRAQQDREAAESHEQGWGGT